MQSSTKECQVVGIASPKISNSTKVGKGDGEDKHHELQKLETRWRICHGSDCTQNGTWPMNWSGSEAVYLIPTEQGSRYSRNIMISLQLALVMFLCDLIEMSLCTSMDSAILLR